MKVSEIGQFGLIDVVARMIWEGRDKRADSWRNLITGIGDDCAVWRGSATNQLSKIDCQVEGVHFNLDIISWEDLGWKSLAVNLSDIAAMGGVPQYALVSLGLPLDTEVENVVSLYKGILKIAERSGTAIIGGNTSSAPKIFVDISIIGKTLSPEGKYLSRSSAQAGDLIAVTGWLGTASAGLEMLTHNLKFDSKIINCLRKSFCQPQPRLEEGRLLVKQGVKTAIDISDGLLADLYHICRASGVGAIVEVEKLPIRNEVKQAFGQRSFEMALSGGEDYELLFTARPETMDKVKKSSPCQVTFIGEITAENAGQIVLINREGKRVRAKANGWDHFKRRKE
jgi:thiamine-monophosphate kinase